LPLHQRGVGRPGVEPGSPAYKTGSLTGEVAPSWPGRTRTSCLSRIRRVLQPDELRASGRWRCRPSTASWPYTGVQSLLPRRRGTFPCGETASSIKLHGRPSKPRSHLQQLFPALPEQVAVRPLPLMPLPRKLQRPMCVRGPEGCPLAVLPRMLTRQASDSRATECDQRGLGRWAARSGRNLPTAP
jgi:hypothetical protein